MSDKDMHESITEHISYERGKGERKPRGQASGYDIGVEDGRKRAWDLAGEAAEWYKSQMDLRSQTTDAPDDMCMRARYETALWIQQVIYKDTL